jgi:hypothetical protein
LNKNRGYVDLDKSQITEIRKESAFRVDITYFKRFFKAWFGEKVGITAQDPEFYRIIPSLRRSVSSIIMSKEKYLKNNEYILIFDDLDVGFNPKNKNDIDLLSTLIRTAREYNNELFQSEGVNSKIFILLREDIKKVLMDRTPDSKKIFSSYSVNIDWYEHRQLKENEDRVKLKRFINRRIELAFDRKGVKYDDEDQWSSLVDNFNVGKKSNFKWVVDHTFYRPRDLILLFRNISDKDWELPIKKGRMEDLIVDYTDHVIEELRNELSLHFSHKEITSIFSSLNKISSSYTFNYQKMSETLEDHGFDGDCSRVLNILFDYSVIGNIDSEGHVELRHREGSGERYSPDRDESFILHYPVETYFKREPTA